MSIKLEEMFNEIQQAGLNTAKNFTTTGTLSSGAQTVTGANTATGIVTGISGTAITAGGVQAFGATSTGTFGIYFGSGAPTVSAAKGSLYLRSDGSSTSTRAYINTDGATTWTAITTAA